MTLTPASSIASGGGAMVQFFDSTLGASAAAIDTGANGVPQTANHLLIVALVKSDVAAVADNLFIQLNGDTGANYDTSLVREIGGSAGATTVSGGAGWQAHTSAASSGVFSPVVLFIPAYVQTTAQKAALGGAGFADTQIVDGRIMWGNFNWRNTAAVTRVRLTCGGSFVAGSRLTIYGLV